jgi:hypothetical protein
MVNWNRRRIRLIYVEWCLWADMSRQHAAEARPHIESPISARSRSRCAKVWLEMALDSVRPGPFTRPQSAYSSLRAANRPRADPAILDGVGTRGITPPKSN